MIHDNHILTKFDIINSLESVAYKGVFLAREMNPGNQVLTCFGPKTATLHNGYYRHNLHTFAWNRSGSMGYEAHVLSFANDICCALQQLSLRLYRAIKSPSEASRWLPGGYVLPLVLRAAAGLPSSSLFG
jgi:hypothetical protein